MIEELFIGKTYTYRDRKRQLHLYTTVDLGSLTSGPTIVIINGL